MRIKKIIEAATRILDFEGCSKYPSPDNPTCCDCMAGAGIHGFDGIAGCPFVRGELDSPSTGDTQAFGMTSGELFLTCPSREKKEVMASSWEFDQWEGIVTDVMVSYEDELDRYMGGSLLSSLSYPVGCMLGAFLSSILQRSISFYLPILGFPRLLTRGSMLAWAVLMLAISTSVPCLMRLEQSRAGLLDGIIATLLASFVYTSSALLLVPKSRLLLVAVVMTTAISIILLLVRHRRNSENSDVVDLVAGIRLCLMCSAAAMAIILVLSMSGCIVAGKAHMLAKASPDESDREMVAELIERDEQAETEDLQSLLDELQLIAFVEADELGMEGAEVPRVEARIMAERTLAAYAKDTNTIYFNILNLQSGAWLYSDGYLARVVDHELAHAQQGRILRGEVSLADNGLVDDLDFETVERWRREDEMYPLLAATRDGYQQLEVEQVANAYADSRMVEYAGEERVREKAESRALQAESNSWTSCHLPK